MAISDEELIDAALGVREKAYCRYSSFSVGAAIVDEQGRLHIGCNVENASYPLTSCAEVGAIAAMVAAGGKAIERIAIAGGHNGIEACTPCGGCRQIINEFKNELTRIIVVDDDEEWHTYTIDELLPHSFHLGEA